jgi:hypothetical protein
LTPSNGETLLPGADIVDHIGAVNIEAGYIAAHAKSTSRYSTELPPRTNPGTVSPEPPRAIACGVGPYIARAWQRRKVAFAIEISRPFYKCGANM